MVFIVNQFLILLWKSWITRFRHYCSTVFEVFSPLVLCLFLAYIYSRFNTGNPEGGRDTDESTISTMNQQYTVDLDQDRGRGREYWSSSHAFFYSPPNQVTDDLMARIKRYYYNDFIMEPIATAGEVDAKLEEILAAIAKRKERKERDPNEKSVFSKAFAVVFIEKALNDGRLDYTIRSTENELSQAIHRLFPVKWKIGRADSTRIYDDFTQIQILVNNAFAERLAEKSGKPDKISRVVAKRMPYPKTEEQLKFSLCDLIAGSIAVGYVVMCPLIVKRICDEKETKAKEMLKMMGLSDWVFWGSHFISYYTIMIFQSSVFAVILCFGFLGDAILANTNFFIVFVLFLIYSAQTVLFCMTITTVFNRPVVGVIVTVIVWICTYAIPFGIWNPSLNPSMNVIATNKYRLLTSFLPNGGLSWALSIIGQFEDMNQSASLIRQSYLYGDLTLGLVMFVMLLSCLLYGLLIWYLDNVWPFQFGVPKSPLYLFQPSYWCPNRYIDVDKRADTPKSDLVIDTRNFEREPDTGLTIAIKNLTKRFGGFGYYSKTAVDNMSLNIYNNQITALLGHNGAGKTTTMNMITGIFPPTSGTVIVDGFDICLSTKKARMRVGLCPQVWSLFMTFVSLNSETFD